MELFWTMLLLSTLAQAPENNPCQASDQAVSTNPDTIYAYNEALGDPGWANQVTITVHKELVPPTGTAPAVMKEEPEETMTLMVTGENSTPWVNCFKFKYTPGANLTRGAQRYRVKIRAALTTGLRGPEGPYSNPFDLTPVGQRPIPVTTTRIGKA